ncbi:signal peptidase I, partial [Salmonella enterica subsp. enterica serovar Javiana]
LNDRVIVSKLTPGPIDLKRGDIVVFADPGNWLEETPPVPHGKLVTAVRETMTFVGLLPDNSENHLIKRVIGLPGDHVVCCDEGGRITINGTAIKEPYLKPGDEMVLRIDRLGEQRQTVMAFDDWTAKVSAGEPTN